MNTDLRGRLLDALEALEWTQPPSFEVAFRFLAVYLPRVTPADDEALAARFRYVIGVIQGSKDRERLRKGDNVPATCRIGSLTSG